MTRLSTFGPAVALADLLANVRYFIRRRRLPATVPPRALRPVGICATCHGTVYYAPRAKLASCGDGCTILTASELGGVT